MNNKNHMKEIADMLGVELDEEFEIISFDTVLRAKAKITTNGLMIKYVKNREYWRKDDLLVDLLCRNNGYSIKRTPWKPAYGYDYYFIKHTGDTVITSWFDNISDISLYKLGNCYRTREEAESNKEKWKRFYASDEVLEVD